MTFNDAQSWVLIISALGGALASIIAAYKATVARADTVHVKDKQDIIVAKVEEVVNTSSIIEKNTNSRLSEQDKTIRELMIEVKALTATIAQLHTASAVSEAKVPNIVKP